MQTLVQRQLAVAQHQHAVTNCLDFLHDMRGQDDRSPLGQRCDQPTHLLGLVRVQSVGGFIENEQAGPAQNCLGDAHSLLEATRQGADGVKCPTCQVGGHQGFPNHQVSFILVNLF